MNSANRICDLKGLSQRWHDMAKKDTSLDDIAESIHELATMVSDKFEEVDQKFGSIEKRLGSMDKRFSSMDKRFDSMDKRFDRVEAKLDAHSVQIRDLQVSNATIIARLDSLEGRLLALENDIKDIYFILKGKSLDVSSAKKTNKTLEQQVVEAYRNIVLIAKEAHITLPK